MGFFCGVRTNINIYMPIQAQSSKGSHPRIQLERNKFNRVLFQKYTSLSCYLTVLPKELREFAIHHLKQL